MSLAQEVTDILSEAAGVPAAKSRDNMDMALKELTRLMSASGETMFDICLRAEAAVTSGEARAAFKQFNLLMRILLEAAPGLEHEGLLRQAILTIKVSQRFGEAISSASSIRTAVKENKIGMKTGLFRSFDPKLSKRKVFDVVHPLWYKFHSR